MSGQVLAALVVCAAEAARANRVEARGGVEPPFTDLQSGA